MTLNNSAAHRGISPGSCGVPTIVCVFPESCTECSLQAPNASHTTLRILNSLLPFEITSARMGSIINMLICNKQYFLLIY